MKKQRRTERDVQEMLDRARERGGDETLDTNSKLPLGLEESMLRGTRGPDDKVTVCLDDLGRFVSYFDVSDQERRSYGWTLDAEVHTGRLLPASLVRDGQGRWDGDPNEGGGTEEQVERLKQISDEDLQVVLARLRFSVQGRTVGVDELIEAADQWWQLVDEENAEDEL